MNTLNLINDVEFNSIWNLKCPNYKSPVYFFPKVERIIVIGDVHGDFDRLKKSLIKSGVINDDLNWIGEGAYVVQMGDQIDSCRPINNELCEYINTTPNDKPEDIIILQFLTNLHKKAKPYNGAVISLIGNHELMNVDQNLSYVSYANLHEFDEYDSNGIYDSNGTYYKNSEEYRKKIFSPGNELSIFLGCTRYVIIKIGSILFVHGGILQQISKKYNLTDINKLMALYLFNKLDDKYKQYYKDIFESEHSPLTTRKYLEYNNKDKCDEYLNDIMNKYKIKKIVVGHTPINTANITKCNGTIIFSDYASSKAFDKFYKDQNEKSNRYKILEILKDGDEINFK